MKIQDKMASYFDKYRDLCGEDNVFVKIVRQSLDNRKQSYDTEVNFAKQNKDNEKPCKVSEEFDNLVITKYSVVPIQRLVGVQLESGMLCAEYIKNSK